MHRRSLLSMITAAMRVVWPLFVLIVVLGTPADAANESICYGTPADGRLENGQHLPISGENFSTYSRIGSSLGRTAVHSKVKDVVVATYDVLAKTHPDKVFVYGETGWASGGSFRPHKTHQNGLSVDFMVPVVGADGRSVRLPTGLTNKFGYDIEFDSKGRFDDLTIDFEMMTAHLDALDRMAIANGIGIRRVIFDPVLQLFLHGTKGWNAVKKLRFSTKRSWVRHDEHYHVDFDVPCKPRPSSR